MKNVSCGGPEFRLEFELAAGCAGLEEELRVFLAVLAVRNELTLQAAALMRAQHGGLVRIEPVDLAQIDLVIRGVLPTRGVIMAGPKKTVREPLGEEHEHARWCRWT